MERSLEEMLDAAEEAHDGDDRFDPEPSRVEWERSQGPVRFLMRRDDLPKYRGE